MLLVVIDGVVFVVRGALQQNRVFSFGLRTIDIGFEDDAVPHLRGNIAFDDDGIRLRVQSGRTDGNHE